ELADDLLPGLRVLDDVHDVELVEEQAGEQRGSGLVGAVVALDAVLAQEGLRWGFGRLGHGPARLRVAATCTYHERGNGQTQSLHDLSPVAPEPVGDAGCVLSSRWPASRSVLIPA